MSNATENTSNSPQKPAITLTDAAVKRVRQMMEKEGKSGCGLRVGVTTGGCAGLSYDLRFQKKPYDNDIVFQQGGLDVYLNPESLAFINGLTIDYIDTLNESGFKYQNPNASSSCGCGTSFS